MKRAIFAIVLVLFFSACTVHEFVQAGRKTVLASQSAVGALDEVVYETYKDAPLDDTTVDEELAAFDCAIRTADSINLSLWTILHGVETATLPVCEASDGSIHVLDPGEDCDASESRVEGKKAIRAVLMSQWAVLAMDLGGLVIYISQIVEMYGVESAPAWDRLMDLLGTWVYVPDLIAVEPTCGGAP